MDQPSNNVNLNRNLVTVIRDIHCPYCGKDGAFFISEAKKSVRSVRFPAFGLKFILSMIYLSIVHVWRYGMKMIEFTKEYSNRTYGFCPNCGNSYSMSPSETIKKEEMDEKLFRSKDGKAIMGFCKGVSEYTGISLLWIRIMTVFYGFTVIGALMYFLIGACIRFKDEPDDSVNKKLYRIRKGKDFTGLCNGFSEYTDIPVMWVRLFALMGAVSVIGAILYFIVSLFLPYKEDVEAGIIKQKLKKTTDKKVILGLCAGISKKTGMKLWLVRVLTVVLLITWPLYWIVGAIVPTEGAEENE